MAEIRDLQVVDANNGTRVDALWPESMPMRNVNDGGRADEGILARWEKDTNGSILSTGTSSQYTIQSNRDLSQGVYDGLMLTWRPHVANADSPTILTTVSPGSEQPVAIVNTEGLALPANTLRQSVPLTVIYDSVNSNWVVTTAQSAHPTNHFACHLIGQTGAIDKSFNVASAIRQSTGRYEITLSIPFSSTSPPSLQVSARFAVGAPTTMGFISIYNTSTTVVEIYARDASNTTDIDPTHIYASGIDG